MGDCFEGPRRLIPPGTWVLCLMLIFWHLSCLTAAAVDLDVYDDNYRIQYRIRSDRVYDRDHRQQYRIDGNRIYDRDYRLQYRLDQGKVYDRDHRLQFYTEGDKVYDRNHRLRYRLQRKP